MTFLTSAVGVHSVVNIADYAPGDVYGPRVMPSFEFWWVLEGSALWRILGDDGQVVEAHRLTPGLMALSRLGAAEDYLWDTERPSSHAFVHFELPPTVETAAWPLTRRMSDCPPLGALADSLFDLTVGDPEAGRERTAQVAGLMLDVFLTGPTIARADLHPQMIDGAIRYVRKAWRSDGMRIVGIPELCRELKVSPGYFSRSFRERFGTPPVAAFELIRLGRAAVALQRTAMPIAQIASACGFTDEFHLSRRFARVYGTPPGRYRRLHGDDEPLSPIIERRLMALWNGLLAAPTTRERASG